MFRVKLLKLFQVKSFEFLPTLRSFRQFRNSPIYSNEPLSELTAKLISVENRLRCIECLVKAPPVGVKLRKKKSESQFAAVLIAICTDHNGDASLLYTRRSANLSRHVRQISFPGGLKDPADVDYVDCALRETEEEIGLPRSRVQVWGTGSLVRPPHTAAIMPVVGLIRDIDMRELRINQKEVDEVFTLPILRLVDPASHGHTQFKSGYSSPIFLVDKYRVWGVTGFLTHSFLKCLLPPDMNQLQNNVKYIQPYKLKAEMRLYITVLLHLVPEMDNLFNARCSIDTQLKL